MANNTTAWPSVVMIDQAVKDLIIRYYSLLDTPEATGEQLVDQIFARDAEIHAVAKTVRGQEEILRYRDGAWDAVSRLAHKILRAYVQDEAGEDLLLVGRNITAYKNRNTATGDFIVRLVIEKDASSGPRIKFVQTWADPTPFRVAIANC